jgi:UDP:flavonoid glycosyltransferase YjiC (YdhE family)
MENSASCNNLPQPQEVPPSRPQLKRAVTYGHYKDSDGNFIIIDIRQEDDRPVLYISPVSSSSSLSTIFQLLRSSSDDSSIASAPSSPIKRAPDQNQTSTDDDDDDNIIVIHYPTASTGDIWAQLHAQHLDSMRGDHKLMGWEDNF